MRRSEEPRHKLEKEISILWHSGLLDMFLYRFPKTTLKNTQNSPFYSILKLAFLKIFKNVSFHFSQFSRNFVFKKFHFVVQWVSWYVSLSIPKIALKNTQNSLLYSSFWSWRYWKFSKMKVFVFINFFEILFSDICLGSSDHLTNVWDIFK